MLCYNCLKYGGKMALEHVDHIPYSEKQPQYTKQLEPLKTTENKLSQSEIKKLLFNVFNFNFMIN